MRRLETRQRIDGSKSQGPLGRTVESSPRFTPLGGFGQSGQSADQQPTSRLHRLLGRRKVGTSHTLIGTPASTVETPNARKLLKPKNEHYLQIKTGSTRKPEDADTEAVSLDDTRTGKVSEWKDGVAVLVTAAGITPFLISKASKANAAENNTNSNSGNPTMDTGSAGDTPAATPAKDNSQKNGESQNAGTNGTQGQNHTESYGKDNTARNTNTSSTQAQGHDHDNYSSSTTNSTEYPSTTKTTPPTSTTTTTCPPSTTTTTTVPSTTTTTAVTVPETSTTSTSTTSTTLVVTPTTAPIPPTTSAEAPPTQPLPQLAFTGFMLSNL